MGEKYSLVRINKKIKNLEMGVKCQIGHSKVRAKLKRRQGELRGRRGGGYG